MLTDLNWLSPGFPYPPKAEADRIKQYAVNEQLFLTKHAEVWENAFRQIAAKFRKMNYDVQTILNYHQLLSKKTADFVCSEPPTLDSEGDTDQIEKLLKKQRFSSKLYEAVIDVSRYGNGVFKLIGQNFTIVAPKYWFPIVAPADIKTIVQHVIAYTITPDATGKMTELYVEIHSIGTLETRVYSYDAAKCEIGKLKADPQIQPTGLSDFAIQTLSNITCSSSIYGIDDYVIINSILQKILWRLHCADTVLDKHSEPSLSGPATALSHDERTGMYYLDLGNYFKRSSSDDPDVRYITWDGNLDANFKEIDMLLNQLYILTEMGQAFSEAAGGTADSGEALKLRMVSPRIKAQRLTGLNTDAIKTIIALLGQVNGVSVDTDTLTIQWHDGLPVDDAEQIQNLTTATGGKPVMSQYAAMKQRGLSDDEVEAELEQIREEQAANTPPALSVIDQSLNEPAHKKTEFPP